MNVPPDRPSRAFTLIEVMVSVAVFALLIAAVYSTWILILKSAQVGQAAAARVQRERIAVRTLEDSLTCIQSFQASMGYYTFNVTNGPDPGLSFVARLPEIFPRNGKFDARLRRLTFSLEAEEDGTGRDLVLRQNPILMEPDADERQVPLVLARHVKDFSVECWDTNTLDWMDDWDSTNSLPPMVRITLTQAIDDKGDMYGSAASDLVITREIAIPSSTLPSVAQNGAPNGPAGGGIIGNPGGNGVPRNNTGVQNNQNNQGQNGPPNRGRPVRGNRGPGGPPNQPGFGAPR